MTEWWKQDDEAEPNWWGGDVPKKVMTQALEPPASIDMEIAYPKDVYVRA